MLGVRILPALLLKSGGLVKTKRFARPHYLGDPVNTVRIFNDKEVDEIALLDIEAGRKGLSPDFELLEEIASECFVPLAYGGGLNSLDQIHTIVRMGFEKVILNSAILEDPQLLAAAAGEIGSQSVVASIDVKKNWLGKQVVYSHSGRRVPCSDPVEWAIQLAGLGAGEILLNNVDRDGLRIGFDISLLSKVTAAVSIPVIACGGADSVNDLNQAVRAGGASAVAAGSMFVYHGTHQAVLINFPTVDELADVFPEREYHGEPWSESSLPTYFEAA